MFAVEDAEPAAAASTAASNSLTVAVLMLIVETETVPVAERVKDATIDLVAE